jgi:hypothetical protein
VWAERLADALPQCLATQYLTWSEANGWTCANSANGNSLGNHYLFAFEDAWKNIWDGADRLIQASYTDAADICRSSGGRLPTATELYRLRSNQSLVSSLPNITANHLWTNLRDDSSGYRVTMLLSNGTTSEALETDTRYFRCVWPSTFGDAQNSFLSGRACNGPAADPCFKLNHMVMDQHDRAFLPQTSAEEECRFYGGRLPTEQEITELIQNGAPNGTGSWLWMNNPFTFQTGSFGYPLGRWTGNGDAGWRFYNASNTGSYASPGSNNTFRCVMSTKL